ncbi:ABC transporter permease [Arcanobacterium urinimassiliense]|uniref:ABC transporter permease n=1 Tax=Arcanobacterium urinimassiliense TaxID=1871014 RepID=UPI001F22A27A|nr:ABC transporter permease [Arcanobacterium urinimassiliense]
MQRRIREIPEYRDRFKEKSKVAVWMANFFLFFLLFLALGVFIRQEAFLPNFLALFLLGQALNTFDLLVIDLLWWRNTTRIRFSKIPQKCLYQDPQKHFAAFLRAFIMYFLIALIDGYLLTLF